MSHLARAFAFALDCLLPPLCAHCAEPLAAARPGLCPGCLAGLAPLPSGCLRCGLPRPGAPESCARCRDWPAGLYAAAGTRYGGAARTVVRTLKYDGWRHMADVAAGPMASALTGLAGEGGLPLALVPVPLHPVRRRARGFNQARLLADALGARTGIPVAEVLVRTRATVPQPGLDRAGRAANLEGAFAAAGPAPVRVGLVDDVATSGATLAAAATTLVEAGAETVLAVSFALALDPALR